jgi:hypothetical protein
MTQQTSTLSRTETDYNDSMHTMYAPYLFNDLHVVSNTGCTSQDSVGEIGTGIWVGKRSENTDGSRRGTARRIILIPPAESWDVHIRIRW